MTDPLFIRPGTSWHNQVVTQSTEAGGEVTETHLGPVLALSGTLVVGWALWATILRPAFVDSSGSEQPGVGVAARLLFWVAPCALYLRRYWGQRWPEPIGFGFPRGTSQRARTIVLTAGVSALFVAGTAAQLGLSFFEVVALSSSGKLASLTAPVLEELVFRGVVLAELINWARDSSSDPSALRLKFWGVMLLGSVIFVAIHWPFWMVHFGMHATLTRSLPLLALSLMVSFVFAGCRSIWACIWLHWLNNQLSYLGP